MKLFHIFLKLLEIFHKAKIKIMKNMTITIDISL